MMKEILWVALGGALGSVLRYGTTLMVEHVAWHPTVATLLVNVMGSFVIGVVLASQVGGSWKLLTSVGFCGGFTTFSTFSSQSVTMLRGGQIGRAFGYMGGTLALCLVATWLGMLLGQRLANK